MNCTDYKQAIAANPSRSFAGDSHAATCESCAAYGNEFLILDQRISKALNISVPELIVPELPLLEGEGHGHHNVTKAFFRRGTRPGIPVWAGLAASVLLAAILGVRFVGNDVAYPSLASEIVAHLDHEPHALRITTQAVSAQRLAEVIKGNVADMGDELGLITYVNSCVINGRRVPHLVVQGERGPITLLLLPGETLNSAVPLTGDGIAGVILPLGKGSIAIIGDQEEPLQELKRRVTRAVKWST